MQDLFALLIDTLERMRTLRYLNTAAATLVVYDALIGFSREWEYIWKRKWSLAKFLYLFIRYFSIGMIVFWCFMYGRVQRSIPLCKAWIYISILASTNLTQTALNMIIIMRLYALYNRNNIFLGVLVCMAMVDFGVEFYLGYLLAVPIAKDITLAPPGIPLTGCIVAMGGLKPDETYNTQMWVPSTVLNCILFFLMFYEYVGHLRKHRVMGVDGKSHLALTPMLKAFYRTGTVWYFSKTMIILVHVAVQYSVTSISKVITSPWIAVVQSIAGTQLILDLRESDGEMNKSMITSSARGAHHVLVFKRDETRETTLAGTQSRFLDLE